MGLIKKIDSGISRALKCDKILTRDSASPGAWLISLLPLAVISTAFAYSISDLYKLCAVFATNLLLNAILLLFHAKNHESVSVTKSLSVWCIVPGAISAFLYCYVLHEDLFRSICYCVANSLLYFECLPYILKVFPRSFTFGEANIAAQSLALFVFATFKRINRILITSPPTSDLDVISTILQVTSLVVLVICMTPKHWSQSHQLLAVFLGLGSLIPILNFILRANVIYWVIDFLFLPSRLRLMGGWAACSGLAWGTVLMQIRSKRKAATDTRKVFHFLAVLVFLTGILDDPTLLYLASGLVFPAFLFIEFIRIHKLPPLAQVLQNGFHVYADEKDAGGVALTPIYLLVGCSLPFWILPDVRGLHYTLPLLSGVLSIGVGDSFASIVGKNLGKHKWSGSKKTVEGSIGCVIGQASVLLFLCSLGYLPVSSSNIVVLVKPLAAVSVATIVEAKTDQVDNIVLPLVTYILLVL